MMFGFGWFKKNKIEKRAAASGFTAEIIAARESYVAGRRALAELTAAAQSCISLWENAFAMADVDGTELLDRRTLALIARSLALRGESVLLIRDDGLIPCADWDFRTRDGMPVAYRVSISEAGGGVSQVALAGEVIHVRIGSDPAAPYLGVAPLKRAPLTADLLHAVESALAETFQFAPIGSQIIPFPESNDVALETLGREFRGRRGRVLMRESVNVSAAGGPTPSTDWRPADVTPDLSKAMTAETWSAARDVISAAFGVLPALMNRETHGPLVREAQRHLATWTLQPIAGLLADEASDKLGSEIEIDILRPLQAYDAGGRARAISDIINGMAAAKAAGLSPSDIGAALRLVDWDGATDAA